MSYRTCLSLFIGVVLSASCISVLNAQTTYQSRLSREQWVDSVFNSLSPDQRIAQLMVIRAHSNLGPDHVEKVVKQIQEFNVGALCFFQGGPVRQAVLTNQYQQLAQTPLMVTIDGEWGLGMRLDSVKKFPYQLTLGAMSDEQLVYRMGLAVGQQCKRIGVHVNYAPVVDINNNPNNPVIGYRSFGEDKNKVSRYGVAYMKGMQDAGIMACAKHFPGHGDVDVDSHYDLPRIMKSREELDSMELVPFRALFQAGVGSVMVAHLSIPSIDTGKNVATSISRNNVTGLLRDEMNYQGISFTDALEMKGVAKYFPGGTISVEAILAGNDMLCLPADVKEAIDMIKMAIQDGRIAQSEIDARVRKVLAAKYGLGLNRRTVIDTTNLLADLNRQTDAICTEVAERSMVLLNDKAGWFKPRRSSSVRRPERRGGGGAATSSKAPNSARLGNGARLGAGGLPSPGGTSSTSGVGFVDIGLGGDQGLAAPAEGARGGDATLPVDGPPGGAGSAPAGVLRAGRPEKIGGFQLVAMFNGPGQEIRIHRSARAGSRHASRGQPSTLASVSKATSSIHNTTERHTRPTMLCRCPA
jgi:beta-glucosidase-like glycosyl hydrolase